MKKREVKGAQSCPPLNDPMDYTVHGILEVRILKWVAFPFSRGSSKPRDWTWHCRQILYLLSHQGSPRILGRVAYPFSRGPSWPRNWTRVSCIEGGFFTSWATSEAWDLWIFTNIISWGGKSENRTNTSTYIGLLTTSVSLWTKETNLYE